MNVTSDPVKQPHGSSSGPLYHVTKKITRKQALTNQSVNEPGVSQPLGLRYMKKCSSAHKGDKRCFIVESTICDHGLRTQIEVVVSLRPLLKPHSNMVTVL